MSLKNSDILKPGTKLKVSKIDFNSPEIKKQIESCLRQQRECLERKENGGRYPLWL